jgi:hypothetical protein
LGDPLKGNLLLLYKPLHLEAQQVSTRIEVRRHQHLTSAAKSWLSKLGEETIGSWEELTKQFTTNFKSTYKRPASIEEVKSRVQQREETLRAYIQRWSIIKNSAVKVSDERAIDAFIIGLRRGDLVEEMGRIKPKKYRI